MGTGDGDKQSDLPADPLLASAARGLLDAKHLGYIVDADWNVVFISDEMRIAFGLDPDLPTLYIGARYLAGVLASPLFGNSLDLAKASVSANAGMILADLGRDGVEAQADPRLLDVFDLVDPVDDPVVTHSNHLRGISAQQIGGTSTAVRLRDEHGRLAGTMISIKPLIGMAMLSRLAIYSDPGHLERMQRVAVPARRPAALLFADLEGSSPLARRLSTAAYFALARRLVRTADDCVVDAGGLVGRHVGDGVAAFFLTHDAGSESTAARACIVAARTMRDAIPALAERSDLDAEDIVVRMGLHWGSTLYVGNITSRGRSEVTALGAEVNEAARIEACATGGRVLASKDLIERLGPDDAAELDIDSAQTVYTPLADLPHATDKARRDAPAISVCEI